VGQFFGGIIPQINQKYNYYAFKISKLAVIDGKTLEFIGEAYPEWLENLRMKNKSYRSIVDFQRKVKRWLKDKKGFYDALHKPS